VGLLQEPTRGDRARVEPLNPPRVTTRHEDSPNFDLTGELIDGRYRVERILGRGGMGAVFLAQNERLGKPVVIKVPLAAMALSESGRQRFLNEIDLLIPLDHPHIVKVLDRGVHKGLPYVVLQYMAGGSLRERAERRCLTPREVAAWIEPVSEAIDFLHSRKVIHRDIKPDNILFDAEGHGFVADFGIAKALDRLGLTKPGNMPGSPAYMAPEAMRGRFDATYDQYALATMVYECLAERLPYEAGDDGDLFGVKLRSEPERLERVMPNIHRPLADCVHRALEREPEKRYENCVAFAAEFKRAIEQPAGGDPADKTTVLVPPDPEPRRRWVYAVGIFGMALLAAGVWGVSLIFEEKSTSVSESLATLDCSGAWSPEVRWPVRVRLDGFDAAAAAVLDESYPYLAVVEADCDADRLLRAGTELSVLDSRNRLVARAPNDTAGTDRLLRTLYLRQLLLGPRQSAQDELQLRVGDEVLGQRPAEEPTARGTFASGTETAWFYVRTDRSTHLLVLSVASDGEVVVHHPLDLRSDAEGVRRGEWFLADSPPINDAGRDLVLAFASQRPWAELLPTLPNPQQGADYLPRVFFDDAGDALTFVTTLSEHLSRATDWSRAAQEYQIEVN